MASSDTMMKVGRVAMAGISRPFGDDREVNQAFPSACPPEECDPFLMCDYFDSTDMDYEAEDEDDFPIGWHPHRGFDIATFIKTGIGRHADSLGNRETFDSPGLQWMSTGSGVYHAEGGANKVGETMQGFQIWINVPRGKKMEDPRYGTVQPNGLPLVKLGKCSSARVLAGDFGGERGPFTTVQPVQMVDFDVLHGDAVSFDVTDGFDTAILYVYAGSLDGLGGRDREVATGGVVLMDATDAGRRTVAMRASPPAGSPGEGGVGASVMLFAGKRLNQPIKWHGPIVMSTQSEIANTFLDMRLGTFPPKCVHWNYRRLADKEQCTIIGSGDKGRKGKK